MALRGIIVSRIPSCDTSPYREAIRSSASLVEARNVHIDDPSAAEVAHSQLFGLPEGEGQRTLFLRSSLLRGICGQGYTATHYFLFGPDLYQLRQHLSRMFQYLTAKKTLPIETLVWDLPFLPFVQGGESARSYYSSLTGQGLASWAETMELLTTHGTTRNSFPSTLKLSRGEFIDAARNTPELVAELDTILADIFWRHFRQMLADACSYYLGYIPTILNIGSARMAEQSFSSEGFPYAPSRASHGPSTFSCPRITLIHAHARAFFSQYTQNRQSLWPSFLQNLSLLYGTKAPCIPAFDAQHILSEPWSSLLHHFGQLITKEDILPWAPQGAALFVDPPLGALPDLAALCSSHKASPKARPAGRDTLIHRDLRVWASQRDICTRGIITSLPKDLDAPNATWDAPIPYLQPSLAKETAA